jgi:hypothetical protein
MRVTIKNRVHAYLLMNNIKIDYGPFTKGFLEELVKVKDARFSALVCDFERSALVCPEIEKLILRRSVSYQMS